MMQEIVNHDLQKAAEKAAVSRKLFKALNITICFFWIAGIVFAILHFSSKGGIKQLLPALYLTIIFAAVMFILLRIGKSASYAHTQQIFAGGMDGFCVYRVEKAGSDSNNQNLFQPSFFIIPYDAKVTNSIGKIIFHGNIRQVFLPFESDIHAVSLDDAKRIVKESRLKYFKTSRTCRTAVLNKIYSKEQEQEIMDSFHHPQAGQKEEEIRSWRILLDQYIREKKENTDIADTVTQSAWYADFLAKRRQKNLGVSVRETYESRGKLHETYVGNWDDGRNTRTLVRTNGFRTRVYTLAGKVMHIKRKNVCTFSILTSKISMDRYTCPNCGSESKFEDLIEGCPFCGTKFNLTSYNMKLSGVRYDPFRTQSAMTVIGPLLLICAAVFAYSFFTGNHQAQSSSAVDSLFKGLILSFYAIPILLVTWGVLTVIKRMKENQIAVLGSLIRKEDPDFSCEEFEGIVNARLKGFFLADAADNIRCFTTLQPGSFSSLADVEILSFRHPRRLMTDNAFRVDVLLEMIFAVNEKLIRREETYTIDLYRQAALKTKLVSDQEIYTCPSCAGTISILNGGICEHCGNVTDMSRYGWVLGRAEKIR